MKWWISFLRGIHHFAFWMVNTSDYLTDRWSGWLGGTLSNTKKDYLEEIIDYQMANTPVRCPVGKFLLDESIEERIREGIKEALKTPKIYSTTIGEIMGLHEKPVRLHRHGKCSCARRGL